MERKDKVKCCNCGFKGTVDIGAEECPNCKKRRHTCMGRGRARSRRISWEFGSVRYGLSNKFI